MGMLFRNMLQWEGSTALNSMKTINPFNPATYSYINSGEFLLSTGIRHNVIKY